VKPDIVILVRRKSGFSSRYICSVSACAFSCVHYKLHKDKRSVVALRICYKYIGRTPGLQIGKKSLDRRQTL
jgi:hypothetical protein